MFASKPPFRPAGCCPGFSAVKASVSPAKPAPVSLSPTKHSYLKRSQTTAPQPRSCSPIKRRWPLNLPLEQALAALKPQLFVSSRLRLGADTDQLCFAYISALSVAAPDLAAELRPGEGWSALQLLGRKPGKLVSVAKALLREVRAQRLPEEKLRATTEMATKALTGKLEDTQLASVLASYLHLLVAEAAHCSINASSQSPPSHRQPLLRSSRLSLTSPRRSRSSAHDPPDPRLESLFCHFLKQGLRDGDFLVPESYEDLNTLTRAFRTSMRYNEDKVNEADLESFQQALKLETVQQWAQLYQTSPSVEAVADTWMGRSINREKAKMLSWSFL